VKFVAGDWDNEADENVIDYDHPKVILLRNAGGFSHDRLFRLLTEGLPDEMPSLGLMMDRELKQDQREGGTWSEIISRDSWTNAFPVLAWLLVGAGFVLQQRSYTALFGLASIFVGIGAFFAWRRAQETW